MLAWAQMNLAKRCVAALCTLAVMAVHAQAQITAQSTALTFGGTEFLHRWSKQGQHEFTPRGQEDLSNWREMVTIDVHQAVSTSEQLADVANRVLANYQGHGKILRTDSRPRTPQHPAEHLIVAMLGNDALVEAAFARFMLVDGVGAVVVYSRRFYGRDAAKELGGWLEANGPTVERRLMAWDGMPAISALGRLPQSK